ncbi:MAG TPA: cobalamin-binding protein [Noviherbaspirillum sp.]|nr:cobalamin-binding protein [Noviherbaspirillum sp.]
MKRLAMTALLACAAQATAAISVKDDRGETVTLARPAQRVITLSPHTTELVFAAGAGERIIGTVRHSEYPEAAKAIARVGDNKLIDLERVVAMQPDLLVVWLHNVAERQVEALRRLGIPMFYSDPRRLDDIPDTLERLGLLLGTGAHAQREARQFRERMAQLKEQHRQRPVVRVFYQLWDAPLYTLNDKSIASDVLRTCGAENVFGALSLPAPVVSVEAVLLEKPDAIVAAAGGKRSSDGLGHWRAYTSLPAVRHGNLFAVNSDLINRPGLRILDGAALVCEQMERARRELERRP